MKFLIPTLLLMVLSCHKPIKDGSMNSTTTSKNLVAIVMTSHGTKGSTGEKTGFYLSEVSHPYSVFKKNNIEVEFLSIQGGEPPVDGLDLGDPTNRTFWEDEAIRQKLRTTKPVSQADFTQYAGVFLAGGHGTMWDFAGSEKLSSLISSLWEAQGIIGAVCHGPAGLTEVKTSDGEYLVKGKQVAGFSNQEEEVVGLTNVVPFLLQSRLEERGGIYSSAPNFQKHVVISGHLVTGQNPASAGGVAEEMVKLLAS